MKLVWPRSEDMTRDQFRPMAVTRVRVALDAANNVTAWANRHVSPSISAQRLTTPLTAADGNATEGATALPYAFPSRLIDWVQHPSPIPVGYWRSAGYAINCFAIESAIDEVALAAGIDPLTLRRQIERHQLQQVPQDAPERAGEGVPPSRTSDTLRSGVGSRTQDRRGRKVRFGGTPKPALGTSALPGKSAATFARP